jgi:methyl-accepting chemotaxis protein
LLKITIRKSLLLSFGILALISALVGGIALLALKEANAALQLAARQSVPAMGLFLELGDGLHRALVIERSLMFTSMANPDVPDLLADHARSLARVRGALDQYGTMAVPEQEGALREAFGRAFREWSLSTEEVVRILEEDTPMARRDAIDLSTSEGFAKFTRAKELLGSLGEQRLSRTRTDALSQERRVQRTHWLLLSTVGIAFLLALASSRILTRAIVRPLLDTVGAFKDIAQGAGDLRKRLKPGEAELGELAFWFNSFMSTLHQVVGAIQKSMHVLAGASAGLTTVSERMDSNARETSGRTKSISAAAEEVGRNVQYLASSTEEMSASIGDISRNAAESASVAGAAVNVADGTRVTMGQLEESSREIDGIVQVITSIARKTHLLALNATIEASRAGDAGKGFAVVAHEVKELARNTAEATGSIGHKIAAIQGSIGGARAALGQVGEIIRKVNELSNTIAVSVEEQRVTTQEISRTLSEAARAALSISSTLSGVQQASETTTGCSGETRQAAGQLAATAGELRKLVEHFRT